MRVQSELVCIHHRLSQRKITPQHGGEACRDPFCLATALSKSPCAQPLAGFNTVCCLLGQRSAGKVSLRVQQLDVACETKSRDNVFVQIVVSVQYQVRGAERAEPDISRVWCRSRESQCRSVVAASG